MNALEELRLLVADRLCVIDDLLDDWGLGNLDLISLVVREEGKPESYMVWTNEPDSAGVEAAAELLRRAKET